MCTINVWSNDHNMSGDQKRKMNEFAWLNQQKMFIFIIDHNDDEMNFKKKN